MTEPTMEAAALGAIVEPAMEALAIPGVAIGVLRDDKIESWCGGVTSVADRLPVDERTIFQIGSISKTFVGTAVMVLVEHGRLDLDEPIVSYVPDLRLSSEELTRHVTLRHLLTHVPGWVGDYFGNTGDGDDALAKFVAKLAKAPQLTPLGEVYSYNNTGFNLAAHVVATITGRTYEQAAKDLVLRPLGMRDTFFTAEEAISHRVAIGHRDGAPQRWARSRAYSGAGGVLSCAADMLTFAAFHLGDGTPLMSLSTLEMMHQPSMRAGSLSDWLGIVWRIDEYAGVRVVHHGGTTNGYMTDLRFVPERRLAWVILTNADHNHQLDPIVMRGLLGPDRSAPPFHPPDLIEYEGHYEAVLAHLDVSVSGHDLRLAVSTPERALWIQDEAPPPTAFTRLAFRDEDRFEAADAPFIGWRGEFLRGVAGRVEWIRWDGRIARRVS